MAIPVTLSSSSVYPGGVELAFSLARDLGYDGVEVMVLSDPSSRDEVELIDLAHHYRIPVSSIHAPTLLFTQGLWGSAWEKIERSISLAKAVGASTVVLHPPFLWQRAYHRSFIEGVLDRERTSGVTLAVENMFPWRMARDWMMYKPHWDPMDLPYPSVTLDVSHAATSRSDALAMAIELGDRLKHVHLCDGVDNFKDNHWEPGRGTQPVAELLDYLVERSFAGTVCVEVNTRGLRPHERDGVLERSLAVARSHLGAATPR